MKTFRVSGKFRQAGEWQKFKRELAALSKEQALERIYSELGSRHKVKRNLIRVEEIIELTAEGPES
jgi:large subunit ribosomal protein LX